MSELYLSEISDKDKPWDKHRSQTDDVRELYHQIGHERTVERMDLCSQILTFALTNPDKLTLESARFCRVRQCPSCQWRRQLMWKARFYNALPNIEKNFPKHRWIALTLTVENCAITDLRETIKIMNQSWKRLIERNQFPGKGFIRSLEVTRNSEDSSAHPHFHVLLLVKPSYFTGKIYIKQADWGVLWQQCLRSEYTPIVHVQAVKDLSKGAKEVLKYQVKPDDLIADAQWLGEFTKQIHKTRAVSVGGVLSKYFSDTEPSDEELIHGDEPTVEICKDDPKFIANWRKQEKRYKGNFRE